MEQLTLIDPLTPHQMAGRFKNKKAIQDFIFAGNATFTIRNNDTGNRFTYKLKAAKSMPNKFYVKNLRGPGLLADMGVIMPNRDFYLPLDWKNKVAMARKNFDTLYPGKPFPEKEYWKKHAPMSLQAFVWFFNKYKSDNEFSENIEIWHEGTCGRCGNPLTVPESIERGLGPVCANIIDKM